MAETLLSSGAAERSGGDSYQVIVHVDAEALASKRQEQEQQAEADAARVPNEEPESACQLDNGQFLHPETARRLACDASVVRILERDGRPLSVGRRTRSVPPALRRALQSRDHCCRFPGCTQRRFLHAHHIDHWAHGGPTELTNLVQLCRFHHRLVHEGGYAVEDDPAGGLRFRNRHGVLCPSIPRSPPGSCDELVALNQRRGLTIGPTTNRNGHGDELDLELAVAAAQHIAA